MNIHTLMQQRGISGLGIPIDISYSNKDVAKENGCRFDFSKKTWYIPADMTVTAAQKAVEKIVDTLGIKLSSLGLPIDIYDISDDIKQAESDILNAAIQAVKQGEGIIVFDTETTGFSKWDEVLQITTMNLQEEFQNIYFRPERRKTWEQAEAVNHISPEMVKDCKTFKEWIPQLQSLFDQAKVIVGHNVNFDIRMVQEAGLDLSGKYVVDTLELFKEDKEGGKHRLENAVEYYCPDLLEQFHEGAHDARTDTWATLHIFLEQIDARIKNMEIAAQHPNSLVTQEQSYFICKQDGTTDIIQLKPDEFPIINQFLKQTNLGITIHPEVEISPIHKEDDYELEDFA